MKRSKGRGGGHRKSGESGSWVEKNRPLNQAALNHSLNHKKRQTICKIFLGRGLGSVLGSGIVSSDVQESPTATAVFGASQLRGSRSAGGDLLCRDPGGGPAVCLWFQGEGAKKIVRRFARAGRDFRLTDVAGRVEKAILA